MAKNVGKGVIAKAFENFRNSFKVLNRPSAFGHQPELKVGEDPMGNKYYEVPPDPR